MKPKRLVTIAMLVAMYVVLSLFGTIRLGSMNISVASLPIIVGGALFGPIDGLLIGLLGSFMEQMLTYGITVTTVLWLIPPAVRGLVVGGAARLLGKERRLEDRYGLCYAVCAAAALCTTAVNTLVMYLDSVIMGYYSFAYVFGSALIRICSGILTAVVVSTVAIPLVRLLRRQKLVQA